MSISEEDGTTGHEYDGIQEYNNPMPRWWVKKYWMGIAFFIFYVLAYPALGAYKRLRLDISW